VGPEDQTQKNKKMKLAVVNSAATCWQFWEGQAAFMRARGMEYHCISSNGPLLYQFVRREEARGHAIEVTRTIAPWRDVRTVVRLAAAFRAIGADIVEGDMSKAGLLAMIAAWFAQVPVRIYRNHGMALSSSRGVQRLLLWTTEKITCLLAHEVIYVSPSVRDAAVQEGVCPANKASVVLSANGLDTEIRFNPARLSHGARESVRQRYGIPAEALVVGFVGRLFRYKGIAELAQAWQTLSRKYPAVHLLLAGRFDTRAPLDASVQRQLQAGPRIHVAGYVEDTPPLFAAMDVLVLPSLHEGLGYTLIEASAMEVPVIGTRISGIVDAVWDGVTGTLIDPGSPSAIVDAVSRYLENPELRHQHGKAGRRFVVEKFRQERVWGELYARYVKLAESKGVRLNQEEAHVRKRTPHPRRLETATAVLFITGLFQRGQRAR
jgi:glycosyltransferase involved in cell wall biosynthesis